MITYVYTSLSATHFLLFNEKKHDSLIELNRTWKIFYCMMKQVHIYYIFSTLNSIKIFVLTIRILLLKSSNKIIQDI